MKTVIGAAAALALCTLSACTTVSEVTAMGKDTYMVGAEARGGMMSRTEVAQLAIKRANAFCVSEGKVMSPTHIDSTGVRGWTPQETEFVFQCLVETDPGYQRPKMKRDPNTVVEVQ
jgi:hypothetical protein